MQRRTTEVETTAADSLGCQVALVGQSEADCPQSYDTSVTHGLMHKSWTMTAAIEVAKGVCITRMPVGNSVSYLREDASPAASLAGR